MPGERPGPHGQRRRTSPSDRRPPGQHLAPETLHRPSSQPDLLIQPRQERRARQQEAVGINSYSSVTCPPREFRLSEAVRQGLRYRHERPVRRSTAFSAFHLRRPVTPGPSRKRRADIDRRHRGLVMGLILAVNVVSRHRPLEGMSTPLHAPVRGPDQVVEERRVPP